MVEADFTVDSLGVGLGFQLILRIASNCLELPVPVDYCDGVRNPRMLSLSALI